MGNIREAVTQRIIEAIEQGTPPWRKGWNASEPYRNAKSGASYKGVNQILLAMTGYDDPRFLTLKQANELGCTVKKGERGTHIIKMVEVARKLAQESDAVEVLAVEDRRALVMKSYVVFNARQIEGLPELPKGDRHVEPVKAIEAIAKGMESTGLCIKVHGDQPAYMPALDTIKIPHIHRFHSSELWASTFLHELGHATGSAKRLNRPYCFARFGSEQYAAEELRAELCSAMMMAELGVTEGLNQSEIHLKSHASYIGSWLKLLRNDKNEIFKAAADAQRMADYLGQCWTPELSATNGIEPTILEKPIHVNVLDTKKIAFT